MQKLPTAVQRHLLRGWLGPFHNRAVQLVTRILPLAECTPMDDEDEGCFLGRVRLTSGFRKPRHLPTLVWPVPDMLVLQKLVNVQDNLVVYLVVWASEIMHVTSNELVLLPAGRSPAATPKKSVSEEA